VILVGGRPTLFVGPRGRQILRLGPPDDAHVRAAAAIGALRRLPSGPRGRLLVVEEIDGRRAGESPLAAGLREAGFQDDPRGLVAVTLGTDRERY
jgi:hypothetical protein